VKAVILAGGLGTRISEETAVRPKPLIEIGGKPILWHIMKIYAAHGIKDFVVCCGYRGYMIKEWFANYRLHTADVTIDLATNTQTIHRSDGEDWSVTLVDTGDESMTGGRLLRVQRYLVDEPTFCFTYGDGVADIDVTAELAFHRTMGKKATVAAVIPPGRFGNIEVEPLERLARERQLVAYQHRGFWQPLDTLRDKNRLESLWADGAPWKVW
jgi:glucose-1-phosphate cytidylyltransferase